jgi:hypothetical protein
LLLKHRQTSNDHQPSIASLYQELSFLVFLPCTMAPISLKTKENGELDPLDGLIFFFENKIMVS